MCKVIALTYHVHASGIELFVPLLFKIVTALCQYFSLYIYNTCVISYIYPPVPQYTSLLNNSPSTHSLPLLHHIDTALSDAMPGPRMTRTHR